MVYNKTMRAKQQDRHFGSKQIWVNDFLVNKLKEKAKKDSRTVKATAEIVLSKGFESI